MTVHQYQTITYNNVQKRTSKTAAATPFNYKTRAITGNVSTLQGDYIRARARVNMKCKQHIHTCARSRSHTRCRRTSLHTSVAAAAAASGTCCPAAAEHTSTCVCVPLRWSSSIVFVVVVRFYNPTPNKCVGNNIH